MCAIIYLNILSSVLPSAQLWATRETHEKHEITVEEEKRVGKVCTSHKKTIPLHPQLRVKVDALVIPTMHPNKEVWVSG